MKTEKKNKKKDFDTVQTFRKIKDKISKDLNGLNFDEIREYLKKNSASLYKE
jgi:hypothetical protein